MQVTTSRVREGAYTTYTLTAVLSGQSITAKHIIPNDADAALKVEDADTLIESQLWQQLWQQLMHHIEHSLRKIAYAKT